MHRSFQHYVALDALRGFAALSVLLYHLGHWFDQSWLAANSFLAVDLFFCLSGYVLSVAYRQRLAAGLSVAEFMAIRIVRLAPLIVLGTLVSGAYIGARVLLLDHAVSFDWLALSIVMGLFMAPLFGAPKELGGPQVFPLNGPQFSLFLELAVNLVWVALRRVDGLALALVLTIAGYAGASVMGLGGDTGDSFWSGFPRVLGGFYAGVAVFHAQRRWPVLQDPRWRWAVPVLVLLTGVTFYYPQTLSPAVCVAWTSVIAPLLVLALSNTDLTGRLRKLGIVLGELSYPIYALHYPIFVWLNGGYQHVIGVRDFAIEAVAICVLTPAAAWIALRFYDEPLRRKLGAWLRTVWPKTHSADRGSAGQTSMARAVSQRT